MTIKNKILFLICWELCLVKSQISIPEALRECYSTNDGENIELPFNLRVLVDIIRKVEKYSYTTMDLRMLSSSLLRRFRFDGIEYQEDVQIKEGILPFSGTGSQRAKHRLIEELIPGDAKIFPDHVLSRTERCMLHRAISNTVMKNNFKNANISCRKIGQTEKLKGRTVLTGFWDCPRQQGVILTPYGTVAAGAVIGAIAASLQHQSVSVNKLIASSPLSLETNATSMQDLSYNEEEVDFVLPKNQMIHGKSMWHHMLMTSSIVLDNIWLATVAGELAEMVVYQGPLVGSDMILGATGFWNNTMSPGIFYLTGSYENFDATRAELLGGIDGLIITSNLQTWMQDFYSLRLSQILYMYYSDKGVAFDANVRACDRPQRFFNAVPKTILNEQTYVTAQMLAYRKSIAYISPDSLTQMVGYAVDKFSTYARDSLFAEISCNSQVKPPRVEALIVFDGAWSIEYTMDFMAVLIQDLDVAMYGSKMGIIHGTSGEWLLNVTDSPSLAFQALQKFNNVSWPTRMNYTRVLQTTFIHLNRTWEENVKQGTIGNLGQVIVLLIPLADMSNNERLFAITLLQQVKQCHPDVYFVYYTSRYNANLFRSFILTDEDYLIKNSNIDSIIQYLSAIPRTLRLIIPPELNSTKNVNPQIEDYTSPTESITYKLHRHWRQERKKQILMTIHNFGYGTMKICSWYQFRRNQRDKMFCTELSGYKEISLKDQYKCIDGTHCPDTYYRVQNVTSLYKCAEIDCKTPDQVRFIIRMQNLYYRNSGTKNEHPINFTILFLFIFQFIILQPVL